MAILGFHFSGVYKDALLNGKKTATVMDGSRSFDRGQEVLVYLSEEPNLFDGDVERRIGEAVIQKVEVKKIEELTEDEARKCGHESLKNLKRALKKWYGADDDSVITYIEFGLELRR